MSAEKRICRGDHTGHLCVLASNGRMDRIRELVGEPQYICFNCGRVADAAGSLCNPMPLRADGRPGIADPA